MVFVFMTIRQIVLFSFHGVTTSSVSDSGNFEVLTLGLGAAVGRFSSVTIDQH